jgi:hypothetical protein
MWRGLIYIKKKKKTMWKTKKQYQFKISNRFPALENLDNTGDDDYDDCDEYADISRILGMY